MDIKSITPNGVRSALPFGRYGMLSWATKFDAWVHVYWNIKFYYNTKKFSNICWNINSWFFWGHPVVMSLKWTSMLSGDKYIEEENPIWFFYIFESNKKSFQNIWQALMEVSFRGHVEGYSDVKQILLGVLELITRISVAFVFL